MGQYEDLFYEIYDEVTNNNLNEEFNMQLSKMEFKEKWEYALNRIKEDIQKNLSN